MHYLVLGKTDTGIETIAEELDLHGHAVPHKYEDGVSVIEQLLWFTKPDELITYAKANLNITFHLFYIHTDDENREMRAYARLGKDAEAFLSSEDEEYSKFDAIVNNAINDVSDLSLPSNITMVLNYSIDFTPQNVSDIAASIVAHDIKHTNASILIDKAIANHYLDAIDDMVLMSNHDGIETRIHKEKVADLIISSDDTLGAMMQALLTDETLFINDMNPLSPECTALDTNDKNCNEDNPE